MGCNDTHFKHNTNDNNFIELIYTIHNLLLNEFLDCNDSQGLCFIHCIADFFLHIWSNVYMNLIHSFVLIGILYKLGMKYYFI